MAYSWGNDVVVWRGGGRGREKMTGTAAAAAAAAPLLLLLRAGSSRWMDSSGSTGGPRGQWSGGGESGGMVWVCRCFACNCLLVRLCKGRWRRRSKRQSLPERGRAVAVSPFASWMCWLRWCLTAELDGGNLGKPRGLPLPSVEKWDGRLSACH